MSISNLLTDNLKSWLDLQVNSINFPEGNIMAVVIKDISYDTVQSSLVMSFDEETHTKLQAIDDTLKVINNNLDRVVNRTSISASWSTSALTPQEIYNFVHIPFSDYYVPNSVESYSVSSTSINDVISGTGAGQIQLEYITTSGSDPVFAVINLNGQNKVLIPTNFFRLLNAVITSVGSLGSNEGDIYIYDSAQVPVLGIPPSNISACIPATCNRLNQLAFHLRAGKRYEFDAINSLFDSSAGPLVRFKFMAKQAAEILVDEIWYKTLDLNLEAGFQGSTSFATPSTTFFNENYGTDIAITLEKTGGAGNVNYSSNIQYKELSEFTSL